MTSFDGKNDITPAGRPEIMRHKLDRVPLWQGDHVGAKQTLPNIFICRGYGIARCLWARFRAGLPCSPGRQTPLRMPLVMTKKRRATSVFVAARQAA